MEKIRGGQGSRGRVGGMIITVLGNIYGWPVHFMYILIHLNNLFFSFHFFIFVDIFKFILPLSQNKCCIPTGQVSMMVQTSAQIRDKTNHLKINGAAEIQHLFFDREVTM